MFYHKSDETYHAFLLDILENGVVQSDRTGVGTVSKFGVQMRFDLREAFPLVTTKKVHFHSIMHELLWFLSGDTNIKYLVDNNVHIWDEWASESGDLGPVYGQQWRHWGRGLDHPFGLDQIDLVYDQIKNNPFSRRHVVSAWNPTDVPHMALPPCHTLFQFYVTPDDDGEPEWLSLSLYQRSGDAFLGVPFNIASYSLLLEMFAASLGLKAFELVHNIGDAHIYLNHVDQVEEQLGRRSKGDAPRVRIHGAHHILDYRAEDIELLDYTPHPAIKAPVAV